MASQTNSHDRVPEVVIGYPVPPFIAIPPPPPPPPRPIATFQSHEDRGTNCKELAEFLILSFSGIFTTLALVLIFFLVDKAHCHAKFSIQSISVSTSSSSATWHVDFLVKIPPESRYSIFYGDDVSVRLGHLNAAVLNTSHTRNPRDHHMTSFSVYFVAEKDSVVSEQLDIKLRAKHKIYLEFDYAGHVDVSCHNLTQRYHNIDKIQCHSTFKPLKNLPLRKK